ncbi:MAG: hypothetical protein WAW39_26900 [Prosthecobacter sp.]|uniref:glycosyltransferase family 39 protein n=1 Tax=Prosthecobacter sp. TaxID=1965333 RepID=UPI003BAF923D
MKFFSSLRWFQLLLLAGLALLCWNAASTTVWDDETNGFFLAREPLPSLLQLMASNIHEDPPLYDVVLHCWQHWAGYEPFRLRLLSILCWLLALWGLFRCAMRWGGRREGWWVLALAAWMPYHWMFPSAIRWYSMFAALTAWNLHALLSGLDLPGRLPGAAFQFRPLRFAAYVVSGAAMWYCNYSAPAVFLAQGLALLAVRGVKKEPWLWLIAAWALIGLCYLPWLTVFIHQLGISASSFYLPYTVASLYAIFAGEVSTPFEWWVSLPVAVAALAVLLLAVSTRRKTLFLTVLVAAILGLMVAKNVIWTKRLLIFTPFLALQAGIALASITHSSPLFQRRVKQVFLSAALLALAGSLFNLVRRDGWLTYRWLVPTGDVVRDIRTRQPGALILSNSNVVAFYCHDPVGLNLISLFPERVTKMHMAPFYPGINAAVLSGVHSRLQVATEAVYIHDSSGFSYSKVAPWILQEMQAAGFSQGEVVPLAMASAGYLKHHPAATAQRGLDAARLVVVRFSKVPHP